MLENTKRQHNIGERGNVLFLILIAVALFAALSYAVTQSTRSGGGSSDNETALISSAQITQYPASVRTAVVRMVIGGTDFSELEFNPPSNYSSLSSTSVGVFHPSGGGATHVKAPSNLMTGGASGNWYFNAHFEIVDIGTSLASSSSGNDLIAFLPGISSSLCNRLNQELSVSGDTVAATDISASYTQLMDNSYSLPSSEVILGQSAGTNTEGLKGQPFGCFRNGQSGEYVYYHLILEQ